MFKLMDKKIIAILRKLFLLNWPYDLYDFSSINFWFGSMVLTKSGILLNNQMADFSLPKEGNKLVSIEPFVYWKPLVPKIKIHFFRLRRICLGSVGRQTFLNEKSIKIYKKKKV